MKDIKDYIHLYWGCEVSVKNIDSRYTRFVTHEFINSYYDEDSDSFLNDPKLLLRPLNDMTEEEARALLRFNEGEVTKVHKFNNAGFYFKFANDSMSYPKYYGSLNPPQFLFILSKGFDLFNLIPDGLAIDKTKLPDQ